MRNLPKLLFQRVVIVSLAILLQIAVVVTGIFWLRDYRWWINTALRVLSWAAVIVIISGRSNPSYKIAWIVPLLAFPAAGLTVYLLFGGNRTSAHYNRKMRSIETVKFASLRQEPQTLEALREQNGSSYNHARYLLSASGFPVYTHTEAVYYSDGEPAWQAMLQALEEAEYFIFLEFFIIGKGRMWDAILEILRKKAAQGVDVRIIYDDFGCITRLPMRYARQLCEQGIEARAFNPYIPVMSARLNNRDHRKLLIIDGKTGFTGGVNLADEYINETRPFGRWKDCGICLRGEAVWPMTVMFLSMWDFICRQEEDVQAFLPQASFPEAEGYFQPFSDSPLDSEDVGATVYQSMISSARESVWIMTPYLILDDKMTASLCVAAKTGVDVRIITPGTPDKWYVHAVTQANYEVLTEAGVRIFEYRPGFLHSKVCLSDGRCAMVGTVNLDFRSLYLHFEDAVYLTGSPVLEDIAADFRRTFPECREITYARCRHTHLYQRIIRMLLRVFSPLM